MPGDNKTTMNIDTKDPEETKKSQDPPTDQDLNPDADESAIPSDNTTEMDVDTKDPEETKQAPKNPPKDQDLNPDVTVIESAIAGNNATEVNVDTKDREGAKQAQDPPNDQDVNPSATVVESAIPGDNTTEMDVDTKDPEETKRAQDPPKDQDVNPSATVVESAIPGDNTTEMDVDTTDPEETKQAQDPPKDQDLKVESAIPGDSKTTMDADTKDPEETKQAQDPPKEQDLKNLDATVVESAIPTDTATEMDVDTKDPDGTERAVDPPKDQNLNPDTNVVESLQDAFEGYKVREGVSKARPKKSNQKRSLAKAKISIHLKTRKEEKPTESPERALSPPVDGSAALPGLSSDNEVEVMDLFDETEEDFGDFGSYYANSDNHDSFMSFYEDSHEEQLPSFQEFQKRMKEEKLRKDLAAFDKKDIQGRSEIERILSAQIKEKKAATERSVEKYKMRIKNDEKRDRQRLNMLYRQRTASNEDKIVQSQKILQRRHQKEIQTAGHQHQQRVQQRQVPEQMAAAEWQTTVRSIQVKQQRQLQELNVKAEQLKNKTEMEYKREEEKIRKLYNGKMADTETSRQKLATKLYNHFQQLRQRYLKRHLQRVVKEREELLERKADDAQKTDAESGNDKTFTPKEVAKTTIEEKAELNPPSPMKSMQKWVEEQGGPSAAAADRHKHRKGVMSQTRRQLSVEIHNEGVWFSIIKSGQDDDKRTDKVNPSPSLDKEEFLAWGIKAHSFLESIVCGEIPSYFGDSDVFSEFTAVLGGQVRCIISDLRTSLQAASYDRAMAVQELEASGLQDIEKKCTELNRIVVEVEKASKKTEAEEKECVAATETTAKDVLKARRCLEEFKVKFRNYLGPDGTPLQTTNPSDRQELAKAMMQYKSHLESALRREQAVKQKLAAARTRLQKLQGQARTATRNSHVAAGMLKKKRASLSTSRSSRSPRTKQSEAADLDRASHRVKDTISALKRAASKRREQSVQKQSNSSSSAWVQSFPGLSNSLIKSLWHKMHRRKQQIILRPAEESLVNGLRAHVSRRITPKGNLKERKTSMEDELIKAEQMFLVATHPLAEQELSTVPPSKSGDMWAEPGSCLFLNVPSGQKEDDSILPRAASFPVLERNAAEHASAPGRQTASLLRAPQLRCLASPLSSFAIASSPAESSASLNLPLTYTESDPLFSTKEDEEKGYSVSLKSPTTRSTSQNRRRPPSVKTSADKKSNASRASAATSSAATLASSAATASKSTPASSKVVSSPDTAAKASMTSKAAKGAVARRTSDASTRKRRSSGKGPSASPRSQKRKVDTQAVKAAASMQSTTRSPSPQKRPSLGPGNVPMMAGPYAGQYMQPPQQQLPQQGHHRPGQGHPQSPSKEQGHHQQAPRQHPQHSQYSSQQVAQFHMMQQQASRGQVNPGFPQMQQFFAPSPLSHPNGGRGMPNAMQMQQARAMHPHQQMMPSPGQPGTPQGMPRGPPQGQQPRGPPQQQGNRGPNDSNDPLFMLK